MATFNLAFSPNFIAPVYNSTLEKLKNQYFFCYFFQYLTIITNSFTIVLRYGQNILSIGVVMSKLKELRIKAALNISELNRLSGVSRPTIEKIERDESVRADLASALCRVLSEKLGYEVTIENAEIKVL